MKALLATAALVVAVSDGIAGFGSGLLATNRWDDQALGAYAQAPLTAQQRRNLARRPIISLDGRIHSPNPAFDVYDTQDRYIGSDPDPFIRNDLARDPPDRDD